MAAGSYLGSKISLISKSEIRYEGILYSINTENSTVALSKVRSFGSEDRPTDRPVAARDDIFDYIIFRGCDIKDLRVCEAPKPQPTLTGGLPNDPAIVHHSSKSTSLSQYGESVPAQQNPAGSNFGVIGSNPPFMGQHKQTSSSIFRTDSGETGSGLDNLGLVSGGGSRYSSGNDRSLTPSQLNQKTSAASVQALPSQSPPEFKSVYTNNFVSSSNGGQPKTVISSGAAPLFNYRPGTSPVMDGGRRSASPRGSNENLTFRNVSRRGNFRGPSNTGFNSGFNRTGMNAPGGGSGGGNYDNYRNNRNNYNSGNRSNYNNGNRNNYNNGNYGGRGRNNNAVIGGVPGRPQPSGGELSQDLKFEGDYDFESENSKFESILKKLQTTSLKSSSGESHEESTTDKEGSNKNKSVEVGEADSTEDSIGGQGNNGKGDGVSDQLNAHDKEEETVVYYDKKKSFFDTISCEASQSSNKQKGGQRNNYRSAGNSNQNNYRQRRSFNNNNNRYPNTEDRMNRYPVTEERMNRYPVADDRMNRETFGQQDKSSYHSASGSNNGGGGGGRYYNNNQNNNYRNYNNQRPRDNNYGSRNGGGGYVQRGGYQHHDTGYYNNRQSGFGGGHGGSGGSGRFSRESRPSIEAV